MRAIQAVMSGRPGTVASVGSRPWEEAFLHSMSQPRCLPLLVFIAHRLAVRLSDSELLSLRGLLGDYVYAVRPGSEESFLRGISDADRARLDAALSCELIGAVSDVALSTNGVDHYELTKLGTMISEAEANRATGSIVERWIELSRCIGVPNSLFLHCYM